MRVPPDKTRELEHHRWALGRQALAAIAAGALGLAPVLVTVAPAAAPVVAAGRIARAPGGNLRNLRPGVGRRLAGRFGGFGFDDDLEGAGFGLAGGLVGAGLQAPAAGPSGAAPFPPGFPPFGFGPAGSPPPPCVRPQIIRLGGGPRRTGVRVVYGAPPCGT